MRYAFTFSLVFISAALNAAGQVCRPLSDVETWGVVLYAVRGEESKAATRFVLTLRNNSDSAIFVATNPVRVNGSEGFYISQGDRPNLITAASRVYPPTYPSPYGPETTVTLVRIAPGECLELDVSLILPLEETVPPNDLHIHNKNFARIDIQMVEFVLGYFIEEEGLLNLLERKHFGWYVSGNELMESKSGQVRLYEVQKVVSSGIMTFEEN